MAHLDITHHFGAKLAKRGGRLDARWGNGCGKRRSLYGE